MPSATERFKVGDAVEWWPSRFSRRSHENGTYLGTVEAVTAKKVLLACDAFRPYGYCARPTGKWVRSAPIPSDPFRVHVSPGSLVHVDCTPTPSEDRPDGE